MSASPSTAAKAPAPGNRLQTTRYDRVSSLLVTLLVLVGLAVLVMFVAWLSHRIFARQAAVPVQVEQIGTGESALVEGPELDTPPAEEIRQEIDLNPPQVGETLVALSSVVATQSAMFDDPSMDRAARPGGGRLPSGGRPGRARAWEVRFESSTLEAYAKQLDFFGIELGVLLPGNKVAYAYELSKAKPSQRTGAADEEKRYYLTWRQGELQAADRELLAKAGIEAKERLILKFVPEQWEQRLAELEKAQAGAESEQVRKTRFGVRPTASGFEFFVIEQYLK